MSTDNNVGITLGEVKGLFADLNEKLTSDNGQEWHRALKVFLKKQNPWFTIETIKNVLWDMIALGHYDWVNSDINEKNFGPKTLILGQELKLYHFNRSISSDEVIKLMDRDGFRPATLGDLLDFGAKNPEEQRKYPIVALGSVARLGDFHAVAYLGGSVSDRHLDLYYRGGDRSVGRRFLAVRK